MRMRRPEGALPANQGDLKTDQAIQPPSGSQQALCCRQRHCRLPFSCCGRPAPAPCQEKQQCAPLLQPQVTWNVQCIWQLAVVCMHVLNALCPCRSTRTPAAALAATRAGTPQARYDPDPDPAAPTARQLPPGPLAPPPERAAASHLHSSLCPPSFQGFTWLSCVMAGEERLYQPNGMNKQWESAWLESQHAHAQLPSKVGCPMLPTTSPLLALTCAAHGLRSMS